MTAIKYRYEDVDGLKVFYREAGHADASALLLLHGFPSASHMFRDLIPHLADRFHIIAPDLPGFGQSEMPARSKFSYTFDNIAGVIDRFTEVVGLKRFAIYVFDYGAPAGVRKTTWRGVGIPSATKICLATTFSIATAEASTPEPVYGMNIDSSSPCTQPSSP